MKNDINIKWQRLALNAGGDPGNKTTPSEADETLCHVREGAVVGWGGGLRGGGRGEGVRGRGGGDVGSGGRKENGRESERGKV